MAPLMRIISGSLFLNHLEKWRLIAFILHSRFVALKKA